MKQRVLKAIVCVMLIFAVVILPTCALAGSTAYVYKLNQGGVNFRGLKSDGTYYVKSLMKKGTKVLYAGSKRDQMYKVYTASGSSGYIYKGYLSAYGAIPKNRVGVITKSTKTYRKGSKTMYKNGSISKGSIVLVYAYNSNWAKCKTMSGKTIYLPRNTIQRAF